MPGRLQSVPRQWRQQLLHSAGFFILRCQSLCQQEHCHRNTLFIYLSGPGVPILRDSHSIPSCSYLYTADTSTAMEDVHDSPMLSHDEGVFFQASTDRMNPFNKNKTLYSMWPISLAMLNRFPGRVDTCLGDCYRSTLSQGMVQKSQAFYSPTWTSWWMSCSRCNGQQLYDATDDSSMMH